MTAPAAKPPRPQPQPQRASADAELATAAPARRGGSDEGGQYSFHDVTSRFARNPRFATVGPKIPFIGECTLNGPARIQPSLAPSAAPIPPRHQAYRGASFFTRVPFDPPPPSVPHQNFVITARKPDRIFVAESIRRLVPIFHSAEAKRPRPCRYRRSRNSHAMMSGVSWSSIKVMRSRSSNLRFFRRCT